MGVKEDLEARIGQVTGVGEWHTVTQEAIDQFDVFLWVVIMDIRLGCF